MGDYKKHANYHESCFTGKENKGHTSNRNDLTLRLGVF